mmetsp:Transcript_54363/g.100400  ORF Transcript_54363/g.100400 Transcript_54363/m.100400 type:complete len:363 (-) Transcript_54363:89-1177(-)
MGCGRSVPAETPVTPLSPTAAESPEIDATGERLFEPAAQALRDAATASDAAPTQTEVEILSDKEVGVVKRELTLESIKVPVQQDILVSDVFDDDFGSSIVHVPPPVHLFSQLPPANGHRGTVKVLLIRHAQSSRKSSSDTDGFNVTGAVDLGLSNLGHEQAARLGQWLAHELRRLVPDNLLVVSSPMRQCLLTMLPAIEALRLPRDICVCHGSAYEFGHAGVDVPAGATATEIEEEWPFRCVEFGSSGWDYRGVSPVETGPELLLRMRRLGSWFAEVAIPELLQRKGRETPVLVACMHETLLDLLIRMLVDGEKPWDYSREIKYRIQNSYVAELSWSGDGTVRLVRKSSGDHLRFAVQSLIS